MLNIDENPVVLLSKLIILIIIISFVFAYLGDLGFSKNP